MGSIPNVSTWIHIGCSTARLRLPNTNADAQSVERTTLNARSLFAFFCFAFIFFSCTPRWQILGLIG